MYRCRNLARCASVWLILLLMGFFWGCTSGRTPRDTTVESTLVAQTNTIQSETVSSETTETLETTRTTRIENDPSLAWTVPPSGDWADIVNPEPITAQKPRRFIEGNGISITEQVLARQENETNTLVVISPIISGLKDEQLQTELNERFKATTEAFWHKPLPAWRGIDNRIYDLSSPMSTTVTAVANYSCNHVLSLLFYKSVVYPSRDANGMQFYAEDMMPVTIDLTNGKLMGLNQVFTDGTDYERLINDAIQAELSKLSELEYLLCAPFQGIAPDQPFSLQQDMLVMYMDERNPEFLLEGRPFAFYFPLNLFDQHIAVYDRIYADFDMYSGEIWRTSVANPIHYKTTEASIQDDLTGIIADVSLPEWIDLPVSLQKKVDAFCGEAALKKQLSETLQILGNKLGKDKTCFLNVVVQFNAAGYLSLSSELYLGTTDENNVYQSLNQYRTLNLDTETGMELKLKDLYPVSTTWEDMVQQVILSQNTDLTPAATKAFVREAIANNRFTFSDYSMILYPGFDPKASLPNYPIWISADILPSIRDWMQ